MVKANSTGRKEYRIRLGPLLREVLREQMDRIKEETYDVCEASYWEAGEIIAKKVKGEA